MHSVPMQGSPTITWHANHASDASGGSFVKAAGHMHIHQHPSMLDRHGSFALTHPYADHVPGNAVQTSPAYKPTTHNTSMHTPVYCCDNQITRCSNTHMVLCVVPNL